jgi:sugar/nucleoside kinase (ribokinase family)
MNRVVTGIIQKPTIVGCGNIVVDIIIENGNPKPSYSAGGTCGNVLAGLGFLGWSGVAISRAGIGLASEILVHDLAGHGVDVKNISREPTLITPRIVEILKNSTSYTQHTFPRYCPSCHRYLPRFRSPLLKQVESIPEIDNDAKVYFFDRVSASTIYLAQKYRESGALVIFEPGSVNNYSETQKGLQQCDIFKYSDDHVKGKSGFEKKKLLEDLFEIYHTPLVILTHGSKGLSYKVSGETEWRLQDAYRPTELVDTCGAGDWTTVGLLYSLNLCALSKGRDINDIIKCEECLEQSLLFAQVLSGLSCNYVGARGLSDILTAEEVLKVTSISDLSDQNKYLTEIKTGRLANRSMDWLDPGDYVKPHCKVCLITY